MNNAEAALAGREVEEETAVLRQLTAMLAQHAQRLRGVLAGITALDVASARARHASWLGATVPPRFLSPEEAAAGGPVQLPRSWHPLLLQPCLPPLPAPPLPPDAAQQLEEELRWVGCGAACRSHGVAEPRLPVRASQCASDDQSLAASCFAFLLTCSGPLAGLSLVPELAAAAAPKPIGEVGSSLPKRGKQGAAEAAAAAAASAAASKAARLPQPTDLTVPPGVRVVAVTGPNTGGKTASLKALGLQCLMAKAGLFLAQAPPAQAQAGAQQAGAGAGQPQQQGEQQEQGPPPQQGQQGQGRGQALLWFDRVLADLGDGQSLQQSLSTFSGHVRRIRNVLAAATPQVRRPRCGADGWCASWVQIAGKQNFSSSR